MVTNENTHNRLPILVLDKPLAILKHSVYVYQVGDSA